MGLHGAGETDAVATAEVLDSPMHALVTSKQIKARAVRGMARTVAIARRRQGPSGCAAVVLPRAGEAWRPPSDLFDDVQRNVVWNVDRVTKYGWHVEVIAAVRRCCDAGRRGGARS